MFFQSYCFSSSPSLSPFAVNSIHSSTSNHRVQSTSHSKPDYDWLSCLLLCIFQCSEATPRYQKWIFKYCSFIYFCATGRPRVWPTFLLLLLTLLCHLIIPLTHFRLVRMSNQRAKIQASMLLTQCTQSNGHSSERKMKSQSYSSNIWSYFGCRQQ